MKYERNTVILKRLKTLITQLNNCIVIVEGKRDVIALDKIGVRTNVFTYEKFIRDKKIKEKNAVILTDFDKQGEVKKEIISSVLMERDIIEKDEYRRKFKQIFGVKTIEEIPSIFEKITKGD
jgi:5S rRNA maturation endonuclease (ribonuclease M5)